MEFAKIFIIVITVVGFCGCKNQSDTASAPEVKRDTSFNPEICKFNYFKNDNLSKTLAESALEECFATKGNLGPAYQRWRDYYNSERVSRDNERDMLINSMINQK